MDIRQELERDIVFDDVAYFVSLAISLYFFITKQYTAASLFILAFLMFYHFSLVARRELKLLQEVRNEQEYIQVGNKSE